jgi:IclR family transcriptional regulator, acetate operon repressor
LFGVLQLRHCPKCCLLSTKRPQSFGLERGRKLPKAIDKAKLATDLARTRKDGYFVSRGEVFVGAIAIAAPYFDHTGRVVGSIGVFGPEARLDERWVTNTASSVVRSAAELSAASGHVASAPQNVG